MNASLISDLKSEFGFTKWTGPTNVGNTKEGWFLLEISPFSPSEDNKKIVSDIINTRQVDVIGGSIGHLASCQEEHWIQSDVVKKAIKHVKQQTFLVAVFTGETKLLGKKPLAVVLEPEVSSMVFPDHPHLNMGYYDEKLKFYFPGSLCLAGHEHFWGHDEKERFLEGFSQISIWLYRHQIWLATRNYKPKGEWIGPGSEPLAGYHFPRYLNPDGFCHCGKTISYKKCHLPHDLKDLSHRQMIYHNVPLEESRKYVMWYLTNAVRLWKEEVESPHRDSITTLKSILL